MGRQGTILQQMIDPKMFPTKCLPAPPPAPSPTCTPRPSCPIAASPRARAACPSALPIARSPRRSAVVRKYQEDHKGEAAPVLSKPEEPKQKKRQRRSWLKRPPAQRPPLVRSGSGPPPGSWWRPASAARPGPPKRGFPPVHLQAQGPPQEQHQGPRLHLVPCRGFNTVGVVTPLPRPRPLGPALRLPTWRACGGA